MSTTYIDTSVLGAYYCPEALSAAADAAMTSVSDPTISLLTEIEFSSLVGRKRRGGDFTRAKAARVLALFDEHLETGYLRIVPVAVEHYLDARELVRHTRQALQTLDAMHLAIAKSLNAELLTADRIMATAARQYGIKTALIR